MRERAQKAIRALVAPGPDPLALYPATVLQDHGDMHLDVRPDAPHLPVMVRVPLRLFLPGAYVRVKPESRVLLGFEGGDLQRPAAYLWQTGSLAVVEVRTEGGRVVRLDDEQGRTRVVDPALVEIDAPLIRLAGGGPPVARVGDLVQVGAAVGQIISGSGKVFSG
ncbi:MAG: hypothetical protein QN206_12525 [Armatimonadota bacterium]|nr:hypothetical protein [Armatimonadota bacterium]